VNLTTKDFWIKNSHDIKFQDLAQNGVALYLKKNLPERASKCELQTSFEFGCYPGNFMPTISRAGYILNGIDYNDRIDDLKNWLSKNNYNYKDIIHSDIFHCNFSKLGKYDLVYSIGFIEHFTNWEDIIEMHIKMILPGGRLIITCPNFKSIFFRFYHAIWDRANYKKHYLPSMNPSKWYQIIEQHDLIINDYGFFGGFHFWNEQEKKSKIWRLTSIIYLKIVFLIHQLLPVKLRSPNLFNCFCGIVAVKSKIES